MHEALIRSLRLAVDAFAVGFDGPVLGRIAVVVGGLLAVSFFMRPALTSTPTDSPNRAARESG